MLTLWIQVLRNEMKRDKMKSILRSNKDKSYFEYTLAVVTVLAAACRRKKTSDKNTATCLVENVIVFFWDLLVFFFFVVNDKRIAVCPRLTSEKHARTHDTIHLHLFVTITFCVYFVRMFPLTVFSFDGAGTECDRSNCRDPFPRASRICNLEDVCTRSRVPTKKLDVHPRERSSLYSEIFAQY